eukprot:355308-Chlamydomonas_euryale.AAC.5
MPPTTTCRVAWHCCQHAAGPARNHSQPPAVAFLVAMSTAGRVSLGKQPPSYQSHTAPKLPVTYSPQATSHTAPKLPVTHSPQATSHTQPPSYQPPSYQSHTGMIAQRNALVSAPSHPHCLLEQFVTLWGKFDDGSGTILPKDLEELLLELDPPLGLGPDASSKDVLRFVYDLDIPLVNGRVPFHKTAFELVKRVSQSNIPEGAGRQCGVCTQLVADGPKGRSTECRSTRRRLIWSSTSAGQSPGRCR